MIKRQQRIEWIAAVAKEYLAAKSAADLLKTQLQANPNYGTNQGWESRDGAAFTTHLESTYIPAIC
jgi:collagenase-like PrtC family protease